MSTIVTRAGKGSPLTWNEVDDNFTNLNTDKYQSGNNATFGSLSYSTTLTGGTGVINIGSGQVYKDASGNVGIGTSSPANKFEVFGNTNRNVARASTTANTAWLEVQASDYYSLPSFMGTSLRQYGSTATGTTAGVSNTSLGLITFQNAAAGLIQTNGGAPIVLATISTERMRIDSSGNVLVGITSTTSGGAKLQTVDGITFPATQVSSSNVNTLDDYKEGDWTPADASGASLTFTSVTAKYTKIGNVVTINAKLTYPTTADTSQAKISGLPYAPSCNANILFCQPGTVTTGAGQGWVDASSTTMTLVAQNNPSKTNANLSTLTIYFSGTYIV